MEGSSVPSPLDMCKALVPLQDFPTLISLKESRPRVSISAKVTGLSNVKSVELLVLPLTSGTKFITERGPDSELRVGTYPSQLDVAIPYFRGGALCGLVG